MNILFTWILLCCCVIVIWIADVHGQGCNYGKSPDCVFPCNCATTSEECNQTTGHCTSQCKDGIPRDFRWSGPGCRVGNVAYGKQATSKSTWRGHNAAKAVDGNTDANVPKNHCFHSDDVRGNTDPYWWYVDLGASHIIYNVTIFNRNGRNGDLSYERLRDFHVYVSDSANVLGDLTARTCAYHEGTISNGGSTTLQCNDRETLGRYVRVVNSKVHNQHYFFALCEVVVIGAKAIDCSVCAGNSSCDPLNGCQTCPPGKRTPDCEKDCVSGTYGQGCEERCQHCKPSSPICDVITGICEDGCKNWWILPTCSLNIGPANLTGSIVRVTSVSTSSVIVSFDGLVLENDNLAPQYYYVVTISATEQNFTLETSSPILHNGTKEVLFDGLEPATTYDVQVNPFRVDFKNNLTEAGEPAALVIVTEAETTTTVFTTTTEPETTTTVLTTTTFTGNKVNVTGGLDRQGGAGVEGPPIGLTAGLLVALLIVVVIAIVSVMFVIRLRRQKKGSQSSHEQEMQSSSSGYENPGQEMGPSTADTQPSISKKPSIIAGATTTAANGREHEAAYANEALLSIPPIHLDNLAFYIEKQKQQNKPFNREYQALPTKEMHPCTEASLPENTPKNRFSNIKPYDITRVVLDKIEGDENSDYINANYITGYKGEKNAFVACQGPRPCTVVDMWRMIWQLNTNRIIMLTRESEGGKKKCERYWPEQGGKRMRYGSLRVSVVHVEEYADFNVTRLRVQTEEEERIVYHFHFTSWFDKQPPEYTFPLLDFWHKVKSYDSKATGPLVVHCSAGVGRTGTYIALDCLLQQAEEENVVDVYGFVNEMRQQRISMVQTREQYMFVYDALLDSLSRGRTIIPASEFSATFKQWQQSGDTKLPGDIKQPVDTKQARDRKPRDGGPEGDYINVNINDNVVEFANTQDNEYMNARDVPAGMSRYGQLGTELDRQYEMLVKFNPTYKKTDMKAGLHKDNVAKNRDIKLVARDIKRPELKLAVVGCTDYINAVFVHSYRRSNSVLSTHMPLPDTVVDLWRLVLEHHVDTIIMLNHYDQEDQSQGKYWPDSADEEMKLGPIRVNLTGHTEDQQDIHTRDFTVGTDADKHGVHRVRQFCVQMSAWRPGAAVPARASLMCLLLEQLQMWQQQQTGQGRVIVHCLDGVERSGVFCACLHIIEKLRVEQEVDIYTSVKHIKSSRKQFITSKDQYVFLHQVVEQYIGQFDNYANFS